jgi:hypothetical protein
MSSRPLVDPAADVEAPRSRSRILLPGPMFPILLAAALPPAVSALASGGRAQQVSSFISIGWASLVPLSLFESWAARVLPLAAALFLVVALVALPFASTAMSVDAWTAAAMCVLSLTRASSRTLAGRPPDA